MEIGSSYTWELTEGNELTDGCFPMLPNGSMIVGTPSALTWNYTGVTEKTTDAKYNRGFCFKFDSELSTKNYEGAIKTIVIRMCQTVKSKVTVLMKVNGVAVAVFGSDAALSAGKLDAFQYPYLQPIITQYFIDNKSEIWLLFLIAHSKR